MRIAAAGAWLAAEHQENGQRVCYAFTRAIESSAPAATATPVTLTVTHRQAGRNQLAASVGSPLPRAATVILAIGSHEASAYGSVQSSAFFQHTTAALDAMRTGSQADLRVPGPGGGSTVIRFSLIGFAAALDAINRACP